MKKIISSLLVAAMLVTNTSSFFMGNYKNKQSFDNNKYVVRLMSCADLGDPDPE